LTSQFESKNSFPLFTQKFVTQIGIVVPDLRIFFKKVFRFQGRKSFFLLESHVLFRKLCFISLRPVNCRYHDGRCILFAAFDSKGLVKVILQNSTPDNNKSDNKKTYENLIHNPFNVLKSAIRFEPPWVVSFGGAGYPHHSSRAGSVR
jgi:hypothetical protein